jgi:hypothetical protein
MSMDRKFISEVIIDAPISDDEYSKRIPAIEYLLKGCIRMVYIFSMNPKLHCLH